MAQQFVISQSPARQAINQGMNGRNKLSGGMLFSSEIEQNLSQNILQKVHWYI